MDRVGVEPTTSAMLANFYLRADMEREIHSVQIPPGPLEMLKVVLYLVMRKARR